MSGPPPPPPPHGQNPKTTSGSGLPPGKFDIFIIPPDSAGGGFLYLPSLRPSVNSYAAGFATAMVLVVITQSLAPAFQTWWAQFSGIGNLGMMLLTIGLSVGAWALGRAQAGGGGTSNGFPGFGPTSGAGPGTFPNPGGGYASPPPQPDQHGSPPPHTSSHGGPQSGGMPNGSWQQRPPQPEPADREPGPEDSDPQPQPQPSPRKQPEPEPEPKQEAEPPKPEPANEKSSQKAPPKPEPEPEAQKNAWERAREETRRREEDKRKAEEERKKVEAENKRKEEAQRRLKEMRARELRERQKREKEKKEAAAKAAAEDQARRDKERRDQEEKEKLVREKELRERELAELKEARRVEKERREKAERELKERLEKERVEKELRDQRAREIKERLEYEAREKERIERIKREQEILERERLIREAREREHREREDKERREREAREREAREREAREREAREREAREREAREREAREREAREREAREAEARRLKEEQENANRRSTYAYTSVGEKTTLWPNGKPAIPHPPAPASASGQSTPTRGPPSPTKRPPPPTARTDAGTEDVYSYRPYDKPKAHTRRKSNASYVSDASWAPSQSTSRTTPPPSTRGSRPRYSTNDPDKIVISAVYGFLNSFAKTPASQLLSGMAPVTDGLILRITTEGIFIDDDVRKVPQREWDVKAWTLKQVDIWCACHSVVSAAAAAAVPSHLHKANGPRLKPSERGTKTLNGPDADDYLQALHTTCENNCKLGQAPADHEVSGPHLHVLRATLRDQEGKRYLFIVPEEEGWKVAIGLKRLRGSSQVRTLGVAGMPRDEAINILSTLGF